MLDINSKIMPINSLLQKCFRWKFFEKKIVFTNGCFDILHKGHIDYLIECKKAGDKLIVGLNSDKSIKSIKKNNRPIQDEKSRAKILASLSFVDVVIFFSEKTPEKLIHIIKPDILIKGSDYLIKQIKGSDFVSSYGGTIKRIQITEGYSSSGIIKKIQEK